MEQSAAVRDFSIRTLKNLEAIERLEKEGEEVYHVTQLINSFLGLLIFPEEIFHNTIPQIPLEELGDQGWPSPRVTAFTEKKAGQCHNLRQLSKFMRNGLAHFNISFLIEQEQIQGVKIWNELNNKKTVEFEFTFRELRALAEKYCQLLLR